VVDDFFCDESREGSSNNGVERRQVESSQLVCRFRGEDPVVGDYGQHGSELDRLVCIGAVNRIWCWFGVHFLLVQP